jgi:dipeptidyl aminopeptidase/acylaminoacyl peptidase
VLAYATRQRAKEIGIRIALGAERSDVLRMIVVEGLRPTLVGVALGTAGATIVHAIRGSAHARTALSSLPGGGRLLLTTSRSAWIVRADGSRRRLGAYPDATWSPHGLYVAVTAGHELAALAPNGEVRWSLARRGTVRLPSWNAPDGFRVAYLAGAELRVVAGNGEDDTVVARDVDAVRPAWKPGRDYVLAYAVGREVRVVATGAGRLLWRRSFPQQPTSLAWSPDGRRLVVVLRSGARVLDAEGRVVLAERDRVVAAAFAPGTHAIAEIRVRGGRSLVALAGAERPLFSAAGTLSDVAWSPDGRWLLVAWPTADQLLFIRSAAVRKVVAFSGIARAFGGFPQIAGWAGNG